MDSDADSMSPPSEEGRRLFHSSSMRWLLATLSAALVVAVVVLPTPGVHSEGARAGLRHRTVLAEDLTPDNTEAHHAPVGEKGKEHVLAVSGTEHGHHAGSEGNHKPKRKCRLPHADDTPSLFCWAVMYSGDEALITSQFQGRAGIFACNDYVVIAKEEKVIGKDDCGDEFKTWQENLPTVKKGHYGVDAMTSSWLNVPVFTLCWDRLIKSGEVWENDFTVKMDPDAVFFPNRLGGLLAEHKGKPAFTTNCRFWGGDQVGKLFGAVEVLSKQAIGVYKSKMDACKNLPWQGWGEDYWMQHCMNALGVPAVGIFDAVSDGTCPLGGYAPCSEQKAVFHPQKDAGQWWNCWKQSAPQEKTMVAKK